MYRAPGTPAILRTAASPCLALVDSKTPPLQLNRDVAIADASDYTNFLYNPERWHQPIAGFSTDVLETTTMRT